MNRSKTEDANVTRCLALLDLHYDSFHAIAPQAEQTGHPVPMDTRGWSQVIVSTLCGIKGIDRKKGADLADGSDVKGANTWKAIDTPRFNGVIKAGTKATVSGRIESLDSMPHLYLVLWDETIRESARCRIWTIRTPQDKVFREMCRRWYEKRKKGEIKSSNFQLHPPRGRDADIIRNSCGNLSYPLYFCAERYPNSKYELKNYNPDVLESGQCSHVY